MRNLIGFDTPSKAQAQEELNAQGGANSPQMGMPMGSPMSSEKLKMETMMRVEKLGSIITSPMFQAYGEEQKVQILMDFTYYSKVIDSL